MKVSGWCPSLWTVIARAKSSKQAISTADARRYTQIYRAASKSVGNALDIKAGLAEVEQQAEVQPGRRQIVEALRGVRVVQDLDRFQFDDDGSLDRQVDIMLPDGNVIICDSVPLLLRDGQPRPRPPPGQALRNSYANAFS